jgi:hypothetical protein
VEVEVHRLGLYSFKGGPPQQEMVQILLSRLSGRLAISSNSNSHSASRKGQRLEALQGRVGQPLTVELPTLAQEYKERLPERLLSNATKVPPGTRSFTSDAGGTAAGGYRHLSFAGVGGAGESKALIAKQCATDGESSSAPLPSLDPDLQAAAAAGVTDPAGGAAGAPGNKLLRQALLAKLFGGTARAAGSESAAEHVSIDMETSGGLKVQQAKLSSSRTADRCLGSTLTNSSSNNDKSTAGFAGSSADTGLLLYLRHDSFKSVGSGEEEVALAPGGTFLEA